MEAAQQYYRDQINQRQEPSPRFCLGLFFAQNLGKRQKEIPQQAKPRGVGETHRERLGANKRTEEERTVSSKNIHL